MCTLPTSASSPSPMSCNNTSLAERRYVVSMQNLYFHRMERQGWSGEGHGTSSRHRSGGCDRDRSEMGRCARGGLVFCVRRKSKPPPSAMTILPRPRNRPRSLEVDTSSRAKNQCSVRPERLPRDMALCDQSAGRGAEDPVCGGRLQEM